MNIGRTLASSPDHAACMAWEQGWEYTNRVPKQAGCRASTISIRKLDPTQNPPSLGMSIISHTPTSLVQHARLVIAQHSRTFCSTSCSRRVQLLKSEGFSLTADQYLISSLLSLSPPSSSSSSAGGLRLWLRGGLRGCRENGPPSTHSVQPGNGYS